MNKKKLKLLAVPIAVASASVIGIVSGTLAYFTSIDKATVSIEAGQVKVDLSVTDLKTYSLGVEQTAGKFENGGSATLSGNALTLNLITPGDKVTFKVNVTNNSNVDMKYKVAVAYGVEVTGVGRTDAGKVVQHAGDTVTGTAKLSHGLTVVETFADDYVTALASTKGTVVLSKEVSIELPTTAGNEYQGAMSTIYIDVDAHQNNEYIPNPKYGFYDTKQATDGHYVHEIKDVQQFRNIFVNAQNVSDPTKQLDPRLADSTTEYVILNDINFGDNVWGSYDVSAYVFEGTLRGASSTSNVVLSGITSNSFGLFAKGGAIATFKNITLDNCKILDCGADTAFFVGENSSSNLGAGSVLTFENIRINSSCVVDTSKGFGTLVGTAYGWMTINLTNCWNYADISAKQNTGGFISKINMGSSERAVNITNCGNYGTITITGSYSVSGIIGSASSFPGTLTLNRVYNYGDIYNEGLHSTASPIVTQFSGTVNASDVYNAGFIYNNKPADSLAFSNLMANDSDGHCYIQGMKKDGSDKTSDKTASEIFDTYYKAYAGVTTLPQSTVSNSIYYQNVSDSSWVGNSASVDNKTISIDTSSLTSLGIKKVKVNYAVSSCSVDYLEGTNQDVSDNSNSGTIGAVRTYDVTTLGATYEIPKIKYAAHTFASGKICPSYKNDWVTYPRGFTTFNVGDEKITAYSLTDGFNVLSDGSACFFIDNRNVTKGTYKLISDTPSGVDYSITFYDSANVKVAKLAFKDLYKNSDTLLSALPNA